jgi:serine/threonine protein kinase
MQDDEMFLAELGVMKKLSHPYIIRYLGCGILTEKDSAGTKNYIAIVCPLMSRSPNMYCNPSRACNTIARLYVAVGIQLWFEIVCILPMSLAVPCLFVIALHVKTVKCMSDGCV